MSVTVRSEPVSVTVRVPTQTGVMPTSPAVSGPAVARTPGTPPAVSTASVVASLEVSVNVSSMLSRVRDTTWSGADAVMPGTP